MSKQTKKIFAWVMTFAMLLSLLPAAGLTALAEEVSVPYIDANGVEQTCVSAEVVEETASRVTWNTGWYVVDSKVAIPQGVDVSGEVHLILADGASLTISGVDDGYAGICVTGTNSLTIYGQSAGDGKLEVTGGCWGAGIGGGSESSGSYITINGGTVTAKSSDWGAGIGGGNGGSGSYITINGGTVTANGGNKGAGIGGGGNNGNGSNITINGGTVTANGGNKGAGIGGGGNNGNGSNIKIATSLTVKADGNNPPQTVIGENRTSDTDLATLLAGQRYATVTPPSVPYLSPVYKDAKVGPTSGLKEMKTKSCTEFTEVTASDTEWKSGWYVVTGTVEIPNSVTCTGDVNLILTDGSSLTISGVAESSVGICVSEDGNSLTIYGQSKGTGKLEVTGGDYGAGIGGGSYGDSSNITINGGEVTATGGYNGAGIGGGRRGDSGGAITINGGSVTANGGESGAGIGSGYYGSGSDSDITINGGEVTASGGDYGAGIGGGNGTSGSEITINGGSVTANSGTCGAGIGGGYGKSGSYITITGGTVTATGNGDDTYGYGDGIGNSASCETFASNITISPLMTVRADGNNPPETVIGTDRTGTTDLAEVLAGQQYATATPYVSRYLSLGNDLTMVYKVSAPGYDEIALTVNGNSVTGEKDTESGCTVFEYTGINPQCMADDLAVKVLLDGTEYKSFTDSVKDYSQAVLNGYADYTELVSNLLTYGAEAQNYNKYNTGNLATDGVKNLDPEDYYDTQINKVTKYNKVEPVEGGISFTGKTPGLVLNNAVAVRVYYTLEDGVSKDNVVIKAKIMQGNKAVRDEITLTPIYDESNKVYYADFNDVMATELDNEIIFTAYVNGTEDDILHYNVNQCIKEKHTGAADALLEALFNYGYTCNYFKN